jgi:hypothetical protein
MRNCFYIHICHSVKLYSPGNKKWFLASGKISPQYQGNIILSLFKAGKHFLTLGKSLTQKNYSSKAGENIVS